MVDGINTCERKRNSTAESGCSVLNRRGLESPASEMRLDDSSIPTEGYQNGKVAGRSLTIGS
jgi:hypothetical protein